MPTIQLRELQPAGSELFQDDESFLNELSEKELLVQGGAVETINAVQETMNINNQQQTMNVAITFVPINIDVPTNINVQNISGV